MLAASMYLKFITNERLHINYNSVNVAACCKVKSSNHHTFSRTIHMIIATKPVFITKILKNIIPVQCAR